VEAASADPECSIVEVGSYCGKSTVVFGLGLRQLGLVGARVYSIDPHDGVISTVNGSTTRTAPTLDKFTNNMKLAGLTAVVEPVVARSTETAWDRPIDFLFVDGLHDYEHVAEDFSHFAPCLKVGGLAAFHDCAPYFPGVLKFVQELLRSGKYSKDASAKSLMVLKKRS
jgi:predicted O-methyltransferase YrrM